jgi:hypothetical protein
MDHQEQELGSIDWIALTQDWNSQRSFANAVMKSRVHNMREITGLA